MPRRSQLAHLFGDELERAAGAGRLEEADRPVELGRVTAAVRLEEMPLEVRERGGAVLDRPWPGSSSIAPPASEARSSCVRRSDAKAARPGSYGSDTVTSARAESASSSPHSAPVRSSNP